uniref:Uncharacterized protein n=1 Tax=Schlesneria paludicola TaxID=360056 RepID=A0A7C4LJE7_9PLAN
MVPEARSDGFRGKGNRPSRRGRRALRSAVWATGASIPPGRTVFQPARRTNR